MHLHSATTKTAPGFFLQRETSKVGITTLSKEETETKVRRPNTVQIYDIKRSTQKRYMQSMSAT